MRLPTMMTLSICATALIVVPMTSPVKAAINDSRYIKKKKIQTSAAVGEQKPSKQAWPPPMDEDFDRKNTSSGGM